MSHTVVAELVAAVMKVEVEVGQQVAADDAVVILESMKMEIPVLADVAGSVIEIVVECRRRGQRRRPAGGHPADGASEHARTRMTACPARRSVAC